MMKNAVNREIPDMISGYKNVVPFSGAFDNPGNQKRVLQKFKTVWPGQKKCWAV